MLPSPRILPSVKRESKNNRTFYILIIDDERIIYNGRRMAPSEKSSVSNIQVKIEPYLFEPLLDRLWDVGIPKFQTR